MDRYSVPTESQNLLFTGIIDNPLHKSAPIELREAANSITFIGSNEPSIPINWRFAESISSLKGFEAAMLNVLLKRRYGIEYQKITINTDHAQLFFMSPNAILGTGSTIEEADVSPHDQDGAFGALHDLQKLFPNGDKHHAFDGGFFIYAASNIYKTKDNRFYHLHGSLNPTIVQEALGIDPDTKVATLEEAVKIYQDKVSQYTAQEIENLMNDDFRQAGTTCWSAEEYKASEHGKANAHVGLYELHHIPNPSQAPSWWKPVEGRTSPERPLFGLKVLDLTRIVASPTITRELAELGASVLRITSPNVTDATFLSPDLGWGKWNAHLDLKKEEDRARLWTLIEESDVVVDGYRPGVMGKYGFGKDDILAFFKDKGRGIIYSRENCYGWNGPWSYRSGWQQISDANTGVSLAFGRAMGVDEAVTPVYPNSDFCTGVSGATGIIQALIEQSEKGGSYVIDAALNYYSQWLVNSCGTYSAEVWAALWRKYGRPVARHTDFMQATLPRFTTMLKSPPNGQPSTLFESDFFEIRRNKAFDNLYIKTVKPILQFPEGNIRLGYNIGWRANGHDQARWPNNLLEEHIL